MYDVVSIGELIIDFAPVSTDEAGYPTIAANAGGASGIFLSTLARYGVKTYIYAKVGDDIFGNLLIKTLKNEGVEISGIIKDPDVYTTLAFVTLDETGNRSFSFSRKPGADTCLRFEEINLSIAENAKYLHFDTLPLTNNPCKDATMRTVQYAMAADTKIIFDPNYRPLLWNSESDAKMAMLWGFEKANIVKICDEEVMFLWGIDPIAGARRILDEFDCELIMLTSGPGGAYLINKNGMAYAPCPEVDTIDTTGAGDIFAGSALYKILETGIAPGDLQEGIMQEIAGFAVTAASLSTQVKGGLPGIPNMGVVLTAMFCNDDNQE